MQPWKSLAVQNRLRGDSMKIILIGQGGHSKVIRDMVLSYQEYEIAGYLDDRYMNLTVIDGEYFGPISATTELIEYLDEVKFVIAIGNNEIRKRIAQQLNLSDQYYMTIIQKTAVVSPSARIGHGTVIMANAVINADAHIGNHAIINTSSIVEHDNKLGNYVHISPRSTLTGSVIVEEGTHIGAGATIIPNIKVGEWSVVGAGATVIRDLPSYCTAVGTPAIVKKRLVVS